MSKRLSRDFNNYNMYNPHNVINRRIISLDEFKNEPSIGGPISKTMTKF